MTKCLLTAAPKYVEKNMPLASDSNEKRWTKLPFDAAKLGAAIQKTMTRQFFAPTTDPSAEVIVPVALVAKSSSPMTSKTREKLVKTQSRVAGSARSGRWRKDVLPVA